MKPWVLILAPYKTWWWKQEDQKFRVILGYLGSSRSPGLLKRFSCTELTVWSHLSNNKVMRNSVLQISARKVDRGSQNVKGHRWERG